MVIHPQVIRHIPAFGLISCILTPICCSFMLFRSDRLHQLMYLWRFTAASSMLSADTGRGHLEGRYGRVIRLTHYPVIVLSRNLSEVKTDIEVRLSFSWKETYIEVNVMFACEVWLFYANKIPPPVLITNRKDNYYGNSRLRGQEWNFAVEVVVFTNIVSTYKQGFVSVLFSSPVLFCTRHEIKSHHP